jgi:hypothetical protein
MGHTMTPKPSRTRRQVWNRGTLLTSEPSLIGRQARCHGTRGDVRALPCRVQGLVSLDLT